MRVTSRCSTPEEFVDFLRDLCDGDRVLIPSISPQPVGITQRFCITLADGSPVFVGLGEVLGTRDGNSTEFPQVELKILSLDRGQELLALPESDDDWDVATVLFDRTLATGTGPSPFTEGPGSESASRAPRVVVGSPPVAVVQQAAEDPASSPLVEIDDDELEELVESTLTEFSTPLPQPPPPPPPFETPPAGYAAPPSVVSSIPYEQYEPFGPEDEPTRIDFTPVDHISFVEHPRRARRVLPILLVAAGALGVGIYLGNRMPGEAEPSETSRAEATAAEQVASAAATAAAPDAAAGEGFVEADAASTAALAADAGAVPAVETDAAITEVAATQPVDAGSASAEIEGGTAPTGACVVSVNGSPRRAKVFAGGRSLGTTPLRAEVECGQVSLRIQHGRGYRSQTRTVVARAAEPTEVSFRLERVLTNLRILSAPAGATVRVQGRKVGKTPLKVRVPAFASSKISVELSGYKKWSRRVRAGAKAETIKAMLWPSAAPSSSEDDPPSP